MFRWRRLSDLCLLRCATIGKDIPEAPFDFGIAIFIPKFMEEAEPLFGVVADMGLVCSYAAGADILNVCFVGLVVLRQIDCIEIDVKFVVFHIVDAG